MSGTLVENMFTNHLKYTTKNKTKKGLGYNHVPPPYNHNYVPPLEHSEFEPFVHIGKPFDTVSPVASISETPIFMSQKH